jgi:hypothetical protein
MKHTAQMAVAATARAPPAAMARGWARYTGTSANTAKSVNAATHLAALAHDKEVDLFFFIIPPYLLMILFNFEFIIYILSVFEAAENSRLTNGC